MMRMPAARADDDAAALRRIETQIQALKSELRHMKAEAAERDRQLRQAEARPVAPVAPIIPNIPAGYALVPASPGATPGSVVLARAEAPKKPALKMGHIEIGNIDIKLGGFFAAEGVYRSRNEVDDIHSGYTSSIPLPNSALYHEPQFVESSRQTRFTALLTTDPDPVTQLQSYISFDFQGGAPTSNANQSNSWVPRLREAWLAYERSDWGVEVLGGQAWTLLAMTRVGLEPTNINSLFTVDATSMVGDEYARQPQIRVEKSFLDKRYWLAVSLENPQTTYSGTSVPATVGTLNLTNPGTGIDANGLSYSNNFAPDGIIKGVADYPWLHLEAFGLGRVFNDRVSTLGHGVNKDVLGGGVGGAMLVHLIPDRLELDVNGIVGQGIGRYGTTQLPDATVGAQGQPVPLPEWAALAGIIGHPVKAVDLYAYIGTDQISGRYFDTTVKGKTTAYGYGNPLASNAGCNEELSTLTCTANTSGDVMGSVGGWYRFLQGNYGTLAAGLEYAYVKRAIFQGAGASPTPKTDDSMVFFSFRWYPFQ